MIIGIYSPRTELLEQLRQQLERFDHRACLELTIRGFGTYQDLNASLTEAPLDILFYDTQQSEEPKDELQRLLYTVPHCALLLMCDDDRHALMGYSLKAENYLLTPISEEDMIDALSRCLRQRTQSREHHLPIKINGIWTRLNMRHITYLESAGHSLIFHMNDGRTFRNIAHYRDYDALLEMHPDFFRCHKSYVVNMRYVTDWDLNYLTLADGNTVNVSRPYRQIARSFYACYATRSQDLPIRPTGGMDDAFV